MARLSEEEFSKTFKEPMQRLSPPEGPAFDHWPYFDSIPAPDFDGHDCGEGEVDYVWRHPDGRLEHILINTEHPDVFMVVVVDRQEKTVVGHHLLDLPKLYGKSE